MKFNSTVDDFMNIDKSPNRNIYLFGVYLFLFLLVQVVNWIFLQLDTKFIHVEYIHLIAKSFPKSFFFTAWSDMLFPTEMLVLFFHNLSMNFMQILAGVSLETSFFWGNMLYTLLIIWAVDYTAAKIYESCAFRISAVFIFITMPGNISGMRLMTVHYAEMAFVCMVCAIYISFYSRPSVLKSVFMAFMISFLPSLYRSGFVYGVYFFAFFVFFMFFIDAPFWKKILYLSVFVLISKLMVYQSLVAFFSQENSPTKEITFVQTLNILREQGIYKFIIHEFTQIQIFVIHFFSVITMKFYAYFYLLMFVLVCALRSFRFFPKKNLPFYLLLLGVMLVPGSVIVLSGIDLDGVSYPLYLILYWVLAISVHSVRFVNYRLYLSCMTMLMVVGCWMLLGSSMCDGYAQHLYYGEKMSTPINNLVKYRPFNAHNNMLSLIRYYNDFFMIKHKRRPVISFMQVEGNEITNIPGMFHYLNQIGDIQLKSKFRLENADLVVLSFMDEYMDSEMHQYGLVNYAEDNLEGYQEFHSKEHLSVLSEMVEPYIPQEMVRYRLKSVVFSPYGFDNFNLMIKYHFWFEKI